MAGRLKHLVRGLPCLLGVCLAGSLGAGPAEGIKPVKSLELLADQDGVRSGESLRLAVKVSLDGEYHVNSHVPSEEFLIPTTFELSPPEGLASGAWEFPKGKSKKFPFSDTPLSIYDGTFIIQGSLKAAAGSSPGQKQVRGVLKYQACTSQRCFPPKKEEVTLVVQVVPPGAPVQHLHPEIFQPAVP